MHVAEIEFFAFINPLWMNWVWRTAPVVATNAYLAPVSGVLSAVKADGSASRGR